jgi:hypothetical protein
MRESILTFVCPAHGVCKFWYLSDGQRVCEVCFPKCCTPIGAAVPVNEDHLYARSEVSR